MTVAEAVIPARSLLFGATDSGWSTDAVALGRLFAKSSETSVALGVLDSILALDQVYQEASSDGWDGYRAKAVTPPTYEQAKRFLDLLPTTVPQPDVNAEPDGEIAFEWRTGPWRMLSVSVGPTGRLSYAALFGRHRNSHGTDYLVTDMPKVITEHLRRLFSPAER
jgi:hypothetical protein